MKKVINFVFYTIIIMSISSCETKQSVDSIYFNAKIYSVDSSMNICEAMAVNNGKIIAIGSNDELLSQYKSNNINKLNGEVIYPGFWDAHCHFYGYGLSQERYADLVGTVSFEDVMKKHQVNKLKEDWWDDMDSASQAQYIKDHPGSQQAKQADADDSEGDFPKDPDDIDSFSIALEITSLRFFR